MKKILILALVFLAGCGEGAKTSHIYLDLLEAGEVKIIYTTKVISDPPGARIELDGDYIGEAPLEIEWEGWSNTRLFVRNHDLSALPIYQGQYIQRKSFRDTGISERYADTIPKTILFDMSLVPMPRQYEIDID